jgi:capsular polysaccharide biosynthesis protein
VNASGRPPNWNFAKPALLRDGGNVHGRAFFTYRTNHYYHFLMDNALRLVDTMLGQTADAPPLTVIRHAGGGAIQEAFYAAAQAHWPALAVRMIGPHERVRPDEVLWSGQSATNYEWPPFDPATAAMLAALFRSAYGLPAPDRRKRLVLLSRGDAKLRRLINEEVLTEIARARGFEPFIARSDNHPDQVRLFSEARAVVAVHGAGLTNLLFATPGAEVLEIFPSNFTKSTYPWMAARLGMGYQKLIGAAGDYDQAFSVDPAAFARSLDALLAKVS